MPKRYGKGLRPAPIAAEKQQLRRKLRSDEDERMREELRNTAKCFHDAETMSDEDFAQMMAFIEKWGSDAAQTETVVCAVLDIPCNCPCSELVCARKTGFWKFRVRDD